MADLTKMTRQEAENMAVEIEANGLAKEIVVQEAFTRYGISYLVTFRWVDNNRINYVVSFDEYLKRLQERGL